MPHLLLKTRAFFRTCAVLETELSKGVPLETENLTLSMWPLRAAKCRNRS